MTKKRRRLKSRNIYFYSFLAIMVAVIISSAVYQNQLPHQKLAAEDYFEIRDALIVEADMERSTDQVLFIMQVRFNLTAVGGDAHNVVIMVGGMAETGDFPQISELHQNETVSVLTPELKYAYHSVKTADGYYPFTLRIDSREASGTMTMLIKG